MNVDRQPAVAFVWENFGPYHVDRLEAAARALSGSHRVVGIEIGGTSVAYLWKKTDQIDGVERVTLFPAVSRRSVTFLRLVRALMRACARRDIRHVFLCHYDRFEIYLVALLLRLLGRRVYMMNESKFDDKPRVLWRELIKVIYCYPYHAALVGGVRAADYFRLLGFASDRIHLGYDTVAVERIRQLAGVSPAPDGPAFEQRHFTIIARLVMKKNISAALDAYAAYSKLAGASARELHICGSGPLEEALRKQAEPLGEKIKFHGFVQAPEIARLLGSTLALLLPSTEEQWGLVINEAIAMGLPVLCSRNAGACDLLVRTGVNGFIFEPENSAGLAALMHLVGANGELWRRQANASRQFLCFADTRLFATAVTRMVANRSYGQAKVSNPFAMPDDA